MMAHLPNADELIKALICGLWIIGILAIALFYWRERREPRPSEDSKTENEKWWDGQI